MQITDFEFFDEIRNRSVPVAVYLPDNARNKTPCVIFNPGYQGQDDFKYKNYVNKKYNFLAEYFTNKGFAFISIQHDILGDNDGLETIDHEAIQNTARKHLYIRGEENILFALDSLNKQDLPINLENFILGGGSNGGDIAKYFINNNPHYSNTLILFDARRAFLLPQNKINVLMFEADDTTTDLNVIPEPKQEENSLRSRLELVVIKPSGALHASYLDDYMTAELKNKIYKAMDWFLESYLLIK